MKKNVLSIFEIIYSFWAVYVFAARDNLGIEAAVLVGILLILLKLNANV